MKRLIALLLAMTLLTGCSQTVEIRDQVSKSPARVPELSEEAVMDFALELFREGAEAGESTLISPLSVMTALAMTANGARGDTRTQMETTLGGTVEELNRWLGKYNQNEYLKLANGIWVKEDDQLTVDQAFLDQVEDVYDAAVRTAPFDESTREEINSWVERQTDGMIDGIIDQIPEEAIMYLVNALAFEAKWETPYTEYQVQEGIFTTEDGEDQTVEMMYDAVRNYLRTDNAQGFVKWYEGGQYAFAALLPDEGVTVAELVGSLDGESLTDLLENPENTLVQTAIPKFESESDMELSEALSAMGMEQAFDQDCADFAGIGAHEKGNLYISRVLHKTHIQVAEQGTKAGAATAVEVAYATGAIGPVEEPTTVYLDRPFVYMIIDMERNTPVFMGTCMEVEP